MIGQARIVAFFLEGVNAEPRPPLMGAVSIPTDAARGSCWIFRRVAKVFIAISMDLHSTRATDTGPLTNVATPEEQLPNLSRYIESANPLRKSRSRQHPL